MQIPIKLRNGAVSIFYVGIVLFRVYRCQIKNILLKGVCKGGFGVNSPCVSYVKNM